MASNTRLKPQGRKRGEDKNRKRENNSSYINFRQRAKYT